MKYLSPSEEASQFVEEFTTAFRNLPFPPRTVNAIIIRRTGKSNQVKITARPSVYQAVQQIEHFRTTDYNGKIIYPGMEDICILQLRAPIAFEDAGNLTGSPLDLIREYCFPEDIRFVLKIYSTSELATATGLGIISSRASVRPSPNPQPSPMMTPR